MNRKQGGNFLLGLAIGLVLGLALALGVAFFMNKTPLPFQKGKADVAKDAKDAKDAKGADAAKAVAGMPQAGVKGPEKDRPKFDFYKILPGNEEPVTEKDLKEAAKAAKGQPEAPKGVYFIQAGSFQNPADADNQKAKIAILGFESSVEPTALPDKGTWYRVRMGPYTALDDLNKVRRVLSQNGIDASLVKVKDSAGKNN